jgi:SNF2 family DNA or RNA helicase
LPEEWLKKYSLLFKMAQVEGKKLRLNKINFNVIDDLHDEISDTTILEELQEKKKQLLEINLQDFDGKPLPVDLRADLRPYQKSGFHWLSYLEKRWLGWAFGRRYGFGKNHSGTYRTSRL